MSIIIKSGTSTDTAKVTTANELVVALGRNAETAGYATNQSENDDGSLTGSIYLKSPETSLDYRLRVGTDTILLSDSFNATAQNTAIWSYTFNTLTAAMPGAGTVNFSTVQGTTSAHGAFMRSFQYFPLVGTAPLAVEITAGQFTASLATNEVWLMGVGLPSAATTPPVDGVWFMITSAGVIGVISYNGSTTQSGVLQSLANVTLGQLYKWTLVIGEGTVEFWKDDALLGTMDIPVSNGQPYVAGSLPAFMMKYNTGAVSNTNTMRVSDVTVSLMDIATTKPWSHQAACQGLMSMQGQNGGTMGTSAAYPNATAATTVTGGTISQTAAIATGLGGQAGIQAAAAGADGLITAFLNPAGTANVTGRNLYITSVTVSAVNIGAAVTTTPSTLSWSLAFGATGGTVPSLAQAESASFATGTAKAWRRVPLGLQSWVVGAAVGQPADTLTVTFDSPIVVHPGQWVASVAKFIVGTATASQVIWTTVNIQGYYE